MLLVVPLETLEDWQVETSTNNLHTNTVTFETSINAAFIKPGDIFQIIDQHKDGKSWGGRISSSSSTTAIKVDRKPTGL